MDVNDLRIGVTVLSFAAFAGIVWWVWARRNGAGFAEAAQLPFVAEAFDAEETRPGWHATSAHGRSKALIPESTARRLAP